MAKTNSQSFVPPKEGWVIREKSWDPALINIWESKFALSNGLLGLRGIYEELPEDTLPGTYLSGFFDRTGSLVAELVNLPNPLQICFSLKGEKLGISRMDFLSHHRELDLRNGILFRHTLYRDTRGNRYEYQSLRFLSMADRRLGLMQVQLKVLDEPANLTVETGLDTSVWNAGNVTEGKKRHWRIREIQHQKNLEYLRITSLDDGLPLGIGSWVSCTKGGKSIPVKDPHFQVNLKKGETLSLKKLFVVHGPEKEKSDKLFQNVRTHLNSAARKGSVKLIQEHRRTWHRFWEHADIIIKGDPETQKALRFNLFHLLASGPAPGSRLSIGAKALTGEGYRNHIFWDADIFLLPFYTHVNPEVAEEMLCYRYDRLEAARNIAKEKGFQGAMYPWESAGSGGEETPPWAKGLDGFVTRIRTHLEEHHITADIAYAVSRYYRATGNDSFMFAIGSEILFATARFWASRVEYHRRKKWYEIKQVIGPDEFHESVDNNAYTNYLAQENLLAAFHWAQRMALDFPEQYFSQCRRINLDTAEVQQWKEIAAKMKFNYSEEGVLEQFDGYFRKTQIPLTHFDEYGLPTLPEDFKWSEVGDTQLLKQADVLLLFQLFPERFKAKTKKVNFQFYEPRTVHQSSLSIGTRSLVASQMGFSKLAYQFFLAALYLDLKNLKENSDHGIHAANLGNVWQAMTFGFGGIHFDENTFFIQPKLPLDWESISFNFLWRGIRINLKLSNRVVRIELKTKKKKLEEKFKIFGRFVEILPNRPKIIKKGG